ncbi:Cytochrome b [Sphingomonas sp. YR710]|uniref:cytochrome b/b6 domain-containing protein n=1 Tax=Sphingomonas sp. YR710 TaxID=1882773 RepID=UPI0008809404|nr:cytochrome b/b6 domain-containing protein [Sphingomonas sp. YR710]SDD81029.1 Cytochrome b [Sphingomonas sp. YR710]
MARQNPRSTIVVWDVPLRLFHWLFAAAVALALLSSEEDSALSGWHTTVGWTIAVLLAFRVLWGFVGGEHARFASFVKLSAIGPHVREVLRGRPRPSLGHNALGGIAVLLLLVLAGMTVVTGVMTMGGGENELHEVVAYALLAMAAIHVVAVVIMSVLSHENLIRAMIIGRKSAVAHPGSRDGRRASVAAHVTAICVVAAAVVAARAYDARFPAARQGEHSSVSRGGSADRDD